MLTSRAKYVALGPHEDSGALSLGLVEQLGHVGGLAPDTWAQSYCLMSAGGRNPPGMGQAQQLQRTSLPGRHDSTKLPYPCATSYGNASGAYLWR